jgi:cytochrome c biogenesis protein CcdA
MPSLLAYLVAIAALDSLNPTTIAIQIYLLSTPKPVLRSVSFIVGVFMTYWVAGLAVVLGISQLSSNFQLPSLLMYILQLIIGVVLFLVGWNLDKFASDSQEVKRPTQLTIAQTFLFGGAATLWDLPTALPYLAAIERISTKQFDFLTVMSILGIYNTIFVLPLLALVGIYLCLGDRSVDLFSTINQSIQKWGQKILQVLLVGLGIVLVADCIAFFLGQPIFP